MDTLSLRRAAVLCFFALIASIPRLAGAQTPISQTGWSLHYTDSQDMVGGDYAATNAFDGNPFSMWVTEWVNSAPTPPHELQINLGAVYDVSGFRYLPRQDVPYGRISQYDFYVSLDGFTWGTPMASGTFPNSGSEQHVVFDAQPAQYVRLRARTEVGGGPWAVVAELNVLAGAGGSGSSGSGSSGSSGGGGSSSGGGGSSQPSRQAIFTPSPDHNALVRHYVLDFFPSWADPYASNAVLSLDLGKPSIVNGECRVDISAALQQLWSGNFIGTVTAVGDSGMTQSAPSPEFVVP